MERKQSPKVLKSFWVNRNKAQVKSVKLNHFLSFETVRTMCLALCSALWTNPWGKKILCPQELACHLREMDNQHNKWTVQHVRRWYMLWNCYGKKKNRASQTRLELLVGCEAAALIRVVVVPHREGEIWSKAVGSQPRGSTPGGRAFQAEKSQEACVVGERRWEQEVTWKNWGKVHIQGLMDCWTFIPDSSPQSQVPFQGFEPRT